MKFALCVGAMITLVLFAAGPLTNPAAAAPTGKCVAFCQNWCATHAIATPAARPRIARDGVNSSIIASGSEAIHSAGLDCFVAVAPRNDGPGSGVPNPRGGAICKYRIVGLCL
jgi:hypothetical protein